MNGRYLPSERLVALFLLAVLLFSPPLLLIFDTPSTLAGVPILYLYLFAAWAVLIVLLALISELSQQDSADHESAVPPSRAAPGPHDANGTP